MCTNTQILTTPQEQSVPETNRGETFNTTPSCETIELGCRDPLITVMSGSLVDAKVFCSYLEASGFHPCLFGEHTASLFSGVNINHFDVQVAIATSEYSEVIPLILYSGRDHRRMSPLEISRLIWREFFDEATQDLEELLRKSPIAKTYDETVFRKEQTRDRHLSRLAFLLYVPIFLYIYITIKQFYGGIDDLFALLASIVSLAILGLPFYFAGKSLYGVTIRFRQFLSNKSDYPLIAAQLSAEHIIELAQKHHLGYAIFLRNFDGPVGISEPKLSSIEHILMDAIYKARQIPVICLSDPAQTDVVPGIFRFKSTERWQDLLREVMPDSQLVVIFLSRLSVSIVTELKLVRSLGISNRTVIIVNEQLAVGGTPKARNICKLLQGYGRIVFATSLVEQVPMTSLSSGNLYTLFLDPLGADIELFDYQEYRRTRFRWLAIPAVTGLLTSGYPLINQFLIMTLLVMCVAHYLASKRAVSYYR